MIRAFIITDYRVDPVILTVGSYMFDEKGNLRLYDKGAMWFFPYTHLRYATLREEEISFREEEVK